MKSIKLATFEQREEYVGVYPLHGYIKVGNVWCALEDLREFGQRGDPQWELIAPEGHHFFPEDLHTVLGFSQKDIRERISGNELQKCDVGCDCGHFG